MFPIDLLVKATDTILSAVGTEAVQKLVSWRRDSVKKFGRELLSYYEDLGMYLKWCGQLAYNVEQPDFGIKGSLQYQQKLEQANWYADELAKVTGRLVDRFSPLFYDAETDHDIYKKWPPSERGSRRGTIMDIYDEQLTELARAAYRHDMHVSGLVAQICKMDFDPKRLQGRVYFPTQMGIEPMLPYLGWGYEGALPEREQISSAAWEPPEPVSKFSLTEERERIQNLSEILRNNIDVVKQLQVRVAATLRDRFTIEDLL